MRFIYSMNSVIFSPHTDDAIFSLGDYITDNVDFTIASAFAGIPTDTIGYNKHTLLRKEHESACNLINARVINGDLLDDVYGKQDERLLVEWISNIIVNFDKIYIPLGIHHPDHIFLSDVLFNMIGKFNKTYFIYAELPYKILYPELYEIRLDAFKSKLNLQNIFVDFTKKKTKSVKEYKSQIENNLIEKLIVQEEVWGVIN